MLKDNTNHHLSTTKQYQVILDDTLDQYDGWFGFNGVDSTSQYGSDFKQLMNHYIATTGDMEEAATLAGKKLSGMYGKSYLISGEAELTKFSPELVIAGKNESVEWIQEHWTNTKAVAARYLADTEEVIVSPNDIIFVPSVETYQGQPTWKLFYKDPFNQTVIPVSNSKEGYWTPNIEETSYSSVIREKRKRTGI